MRSDTCKFKIDENLPEVAAEILRSAGFDAQTVLFEGLGGAPDAAIASVCLQEQRAIITLDLDFSDIKTYPPERYPGIIVLRLQNHSTSSVAAIMHTVVSLLHKERLSGTIWSLDERRVRIFGA